MISEITPTALARNAIETYLSENTILKANEYKIVGVNYNKAGVYVSIKLLDGTVRGCRGTKYPTKETIEEEIILNAISAATTDKRYSIIKLEEIENIVITVHILHKPELIKDISELNPKIYGIIAESESGKIGILLPGARNIEDPIEQINCVREKAGMPTSEEVKIYKFKTDKYTEGDNN